MKHHVTHLLHVIKRAIPLMAFCMLVTLTATAQEPDKRHVTPVKPETNQVKPPPKGTDEKISNTSVATVPLPLPRPARTRCAVSITITPKSLIYLLA